jgi:hypothetical protein
MSLMPPQVRSAPRLFVLLGLLAVASVALYYQWSGSETAAPARDDGAHQSSRQVPERDTDGQAGTETWRRRAAAGCAVPEALKLDQIENKVPDEPEAERNLFRFGRAASAARRLRRSQSPVYSAATGSGAATTAPDSADSLEVHGLPEGQGRPKSRVPRRSERRVV